MEKKYLEEKVVNLNYRYVSAWNEVNTRIAQRQSVSNHYITTVSIFFSIGLGLIQWTKNSQIASSSADSEIIFNCILFTLPVLTMYFYLLNYKHEYSIKVLRQFLKKCEKYSADMDESIKDLPTYHNDIFIKEASKYRNLHDYANILMMSFLNIVAMVGFVLLHKELFRWDSVFTWFIILLTLVPPILMYRRSLKLTKVYEEN